MNINNNAKNEYLMKKKSKVNVYNLKSIDQIKIKLKTQRQNET